MVFSVASISAAGAHGESRQAHPIAQALEEAIRTGGSLPPDQTLHYLERIAVALETLVAHGVPVIQPGNTTDSQASAKCFGVPQQRERLIIASRSGRVPYLAPTNSDRAEDGLPSWFTLKDSIGDMAGIEHQGAHYSRRRLELWRLLKAGQDGRHLRDLVQPSDTTTGKKPCYYKRLAWDRPAPTLVTKPGSFLSGCCHTVTDVP